MDVAKAVLSPVAAVSALCAAADTARITSCQQSPLCIAAHQKLQVAVCCDKPYDSSITQPCRKWATACCPAKPCRSQQKTLPAVGKGSGLSGVADGRVCLESVAILQAVHGSAKALCAADDRFSTRVCESVSQRTSVSKLGWAQVDEQAAITAPVCLQE